MPSRAFIRVDDLEVHSHALGHRCEVGIPVHVIRCGRQTDSAVAEMISDRIFGVFGKLLVQVYGMGLQADHGLVGSEIRNLRGRMPSRAGRKFVPFHEEDVLPAFTGQMIKSRASRDAAADNDDPVVTRHPSSIQLTQTKRSDCYFGDIPLLGKRVFRR